MLFINKLNQSSNQPKTSFSSEPYNRWINWNGLLEKEDWKCICTESVYKYIFKTTYKKCVTMGFDSLTSEEISVSVTGETFLAIKKICQKTEPEERRVRNSIQALTNTISNRWLKNFLSRFYGDKNLELRCNVDEFISSSIDAEEYMIRTELLSEFYKCLETLSDRSKAIISGYLLENKTLEFLANQMTMELHQLNYIKEKAKRSIADCMKSKNLN